MWVILIEIWSISCWVHVRAHLVITSRESCLVLTSTHFIRRRILRWRMRSRSIQESGSGPAHRFRLPILFHGRKAGPVKCDCASLEVMPNLIFIEILQLFAILCPHLSNCYVGNPLIILRPFFCNHCSDCTTHFMKVLIQTCSCPDSARIRLSPLSAIQSMCRSHSAHPHHTKLWHCYSHVAARFADLTSVMLEYFA